MGTQKNQSFLTRLRFAASGVAQGLRTERSLRTQMLVLPLVLIVLGFLRVAPLWWALVILAASAVLAAELFNTALERLADHLHPEVHPEIRIMKDCAAGGVLISSVGAVGVGIALLIALLQRS